jgi:hypothetical protein
MTKSSYHPKFKVGDIVIADGDNAKIISVIYPPDSDWPGGDMGYAVAWSTNEWGTFDEDELEFAGVE